MHKWFPNAIQHEEHGPYVHGKKRTRLHELRANPQTRQTQSLSSSLHPSCQAKNFLFCCTLSLECRLSGEKKNVWVAQINLRVALKRAELCTCLSFKSFPVHDIFSVASQSTPGSRLLFFVENKQQERVWGVTHSITLRWYTSTLSPRQRNSQRNKFGITFFDHKPHLWWRGQCDERIYDEYSWMNIIWWMFSPSRIYEYSSYILSLQENIYWWTSYTHFTSIMRTHSHTNDLWI
jgi:hypothetical protein